MTRRRNILAPANLLFVSGVTCALVACGDGISSPAADASVTDDATDGGGAEGQSSVTESECNVIVSGDMMGSAKCVVQLADDRTLSVFLRDTTGSLMGGSALVVTSMPLAARVYATDELKNSMVSLRSVEDSTFVAQGGDSTAPWSLGVALSAIGVVGAPSPGTHGKIDARVLATTTASDGGTPTADVIISF